MRKRYVEGVYVEQTSKVDQKMNNENQRGADNVRSNVPSREFMMKNRAMEKNEKNDSLDDSSDRCLIDHKMSWDKNKSYFFKGPILFLMKEEIQAGGFGAGYPYQSPSGYSTIDSDIAATMVELMPIIQEAAEKIVQHFQLHKMGKISENLGEWKNTVEISNEPQEGADIVEPTLQASYEPPKATEVVSMQTDDDFWNDPTNISKIEEIENALLKKNQFPICVDDCPSFSLGIGLTQDEMADLSLVTYTSTVNDSLKMVEEQPQSKQKEQQVAGKRVLEGSTSRHENEVTSLRKSKMVPISNATDVSIMMIINGNGKVPRKTNEADASMVKSKGIIKQANPMLHHTRLRRQAVKRVRFGSSTYRDKAVDDGQQLLKQEDVVFSYGQIEVQKRELMTLRPSKYICSSITYEIRTLTKLTTQILCFNKSMPPKSVGHLEEGAGNFLNVRKSRFQKQEYLCQFFLAIHHAEHFSLMCFDIKKASISHFDSSTAALDNSLNVNYDIPMALGRMLYQYLDHCSLIEKAAAIRNMKVERIKMSWGEEMHKKDTGICMMRLMETHISNAVENSRLGIKLNCQTQLKFLRGKYCAAILVAENNMLKHLNMSAADMHYQLSFENSSIDIVPP
ncbi:peptide chain release factor 2 [Striga asiatica]|uniref:Peptide chain release factor 2 n=1 Tax=Striga asiatica TaxID=4170 RepID=A0A5A7P369_STRAF|nr:peptide chain release factor 2 [Striga asiatica]